MLTNIFGRGGVWCSALGCYVGVSETGRKDMDSGRDAAGSGHAGAVSKSGEGSGIDGDGDRDRDGEELEERSMKRRRVGTAEG